MFPATLGVRRPPPPDVGQTLAEKKAAQLAEVAARKQALQDAELARVAEEPDRARLCTETPRSARCGPSSRSRSPTPTPPDVSARVARLATLIKIRIRLGSIARCSESSRRHSCSCSWVLPGDCTRSRSSRCAAWASSKASTRERPPGSLTSRSWPWHASRFNSGSPADLRGFGTYTDLSTQNVCIRKWKGRLQI